MPIDPDPDAEPGGDGMLLSGPDGAPLATFRWREDEGERVVSRFRAAGGRSSSDHAARQAARELAGRRVTTGDDETARALVGAGAMLVRAATDMERDLGRPNDPPALPAGWSFAPHGWDDDLSATLAAAYGPEHPDHVGDDRESRLRWFLDGPESPLNGAGLIPGASARLVHPSGRTAGQVVTAGPVPWSKGSCGWILDIAVNPAAQGRGFGTALLAYAISGARSAGLATAGLSVTDGNPARRLYDRFGFRPISRSVTLRLPSR